MITALLTAANLITAQPNIADNSVGVKPGGTPWYFDTTFEVCREEHRFSKREWETIEAKGRRVSLAPRHVTEWDNGGIGRA